VAGDGTERIDPGFDSIARRVRLSRTRGLAPEGPVAVADDAVLVSTGSASVARLHPRSGRRLGPPADVGNGPSAIAVGAGAAWVTDYQDNTVSRIDATGVVDVIQVGHSPRDVAVGAGGVWVANTGDGTVTRLDADGRVRTTIRVGEAPRGIAVGRDAVWVANSGDGTVSRIDPRADRVSKTVAVGQSPQDVAVVGERVWVTLRSGLPARLTGGGTIRVVSPHDPGPLDPARLGASIDADVLYQELAPTCAKLLDYPDRPAPEGTRLRPEVARAMPTVSRGGRRYTFVLRSDFRFAPPSNAPVTAAAFARTLERGLNRRAGSFAGTFMGDLVGARAYEAGRARHIAGVRARGNRLTVDVTGPAPDLPARLATPFFCAVPPETPISGRGIDVPAAGPYYVASHVRDQSMILRRNPHYPGARPRRPDSVVYRFGGSPERAAADVIAGRADYATAPPIQDDAKLNARFGPAGAAGRAGRQQYFVNPAIETFYLVFNTRRPLFADARMRRAVNFAIDRSALARTAGPGISGQPTDQYLPPGMPGFRNAAIYPLGRPDLRRARRQAAGRRGSATFYTCNVSPCPEQAELLKGQLRAIGIGVVVRRFAFPKLFERLARPGEDFDLAALGWLVDYVDPFDFIDLIFGPGEPRLGTEPGPGSGNFGRFRDPRFSARIPRVARLRGEARLRAFGDLDVDLARQAAPAAAFATATRRDLFSARVGCQVYQPIYGMDVTTLCIRKRP
jgi:peptide/nickel transport system substrate-binding protein